MTNTAPNENIAIYQNEDGSIALDVAVRGESVWLSQGQLVSLFGRDKSVISRHIRNVFVDGELAQDAVVANFATTAEDGKTYQVDYYNLDVIISVGYRVKSPQGVRFRQWATRVLKQHLLQGYTLNQQRFQQNAQELEHALQLVRRTAAMPEGSVVGAGLVDIISRYTQTFLWLQQYDEGLLKQPSGQPGGTLTPLAEMRRALAELKQHLISRGEASSLFALERDDALAAIWGALDQSVFGEPAYPTIESKAAHLLYFVVKNHPFSDGNKRSAAFLLVDFLHRQKRLLDDRGEPVLNPAGLAAVTLLVAESRPAEKDTLIHLLQHLLARPCS